MNGRAGFPSVGVVGVAALLVGQTWDFYLHAADPTLAHREGLFAIANPGHVLLGIGLILVVIGVLGAAYTVLPPGGWVRPAFLAVFLTLAVVTGVTTGWAASIELSAQQRLSGVARQQLVAAHDHQASTTPGGHAAQALGQVSAAQLEAAARLYRETLAAVAKYRDQRVAIADGYVPMEPPDREIVHLVNRAYFADADVLNPAHVQSLIYFNTPTGPRLIGAMYMMPTAGEPGPQVGGPLTTWHHHEELCFDNKTNMVVAFAGNPAFDHPGWSRACPRGTNKQATPEMLHVWLINNPGGPFDSDMDPADVAAILANP